MGWWRNWPVNFAFSASLFHSELVVFGLVAAVAVQGVSAGLADIVAVGLGLSITFARRYRMENMVQERGEQWYVGRGCDAPCRCHREMRESDSGPPTVVVVHLAARSEDSAVLIVAVRKR